MKKSPFLRRVGVLLLAVPSIARATAPDCSAIYPDHQVWARLEKPAYDACTLEGMSTDYAEILKEQARLLGLLRAAYERRLRIDFEKQALHNRLQDFDRKLAETVNVAAAFASHPPSPPKGAATKGPGIGELLRQSRQQSDTLKTRIALAKDKLESDEPDTYCKLDFFFRLGDGLNSKMRNCLQ